MGEILGLGVTHYPPLSGRDQDMANILKGRLSEADVPSELKDPAGWPPFMRAEWGADEGLQGAKRHREALTQGLRKAREALDEFNPDFVIILGDDQYENFKENVIPPFCVLAYDDMTVYPWKQAAESAYFSKSEDEWGGGKPNVWGETDEFAIDVKGVRAEAKEIVTKLIESDFDVSYAYEPNNHPGLAHAFLNSILFLDYDRKGFPWPVMSFQINCYGRAVISYRGYISRITEKGRPLDPPSPSPKRVFDLGAALAKAIKDSPWRVAIIASSSWSHAFLNEKTSRLQPAVEFDRVMYQALSESRLEAFRRLELSQLEETGNQEMLNWCALAGAMTETGQKCTWSQFVETYVFNSTKVIAVFEPNNT